MAATTGPVSARCGTCQQDPKKRVNDLSECSHVACPNRRTCWSDQPSVSRCPLDSDDELLDFMFDGEG